MMTLKVYRIRPGEEPVVTVPWRIIDLDHGDGDWHQAGFPQCRCARCLSGVPLKKVRLGTR